MGCMHWMGPHHHGLWILPFLFVVLLLVIAVSHARRAGLRRRGGERIGGWRFGCWAPGRSPGGRWGAETPLEILDRRYASGEITREEHEQMRRDLEAPSPGTG